MKEISEIRREKDLWLFEYLSDEDPNGELVAAGAVPMDHETDDEPLGFGLFHGSACTTANSEPALTSVQARLRGWGWTLGWSWRHGPGDREKATTARSGAR